MFTGSLCFSCEKNSSTPLGYSENSCARCGAWAKFSGTNKLLNHNGVHILHDPTIKILKNLCGLCFHEGGCIFYLTKKHGLDQTGVKINLRDSVCPRLSSFTYKTPPESKPNSPCSNVPIYCPVCPDCAPAVWKYNMQYHMQTMHPETTDHYASLWQISPSKIAILHVLWSDCTDTHRRTWTRTKKITHSISEAHCSRLTMR